MPRARVPAEKGSNLLLALDAIMKTEKNSIEKITPLEETKRFPVAVTSAFLIVLIASFIPWGTINYHYTWQFMSNMEHPGLCNRIITDDDLSGIKLGTKLNYTGSAWNFIWGWIRAVREKMGNP